MRSHDKHTHTARVTYVCIRMPWQRVTALVEIVLGVMKLSHSAYYCHVRDLQGLICPGRWNIVRTDTHDRDSYCSLESCKAPKMLASQISYLPSIPDFPVKSRFRGLLPGKHPGNGGHARALRAHMHGTRTVLARYLAS